MESRMEPLHEAWRSYVVEFPDFPKLRQAGREHSQQVLFVCPRGEKNVAQLWSSASTAPVIVHELPVQEGAEPAPLARFVVFLASNESLDLGAALHHYRQRTSAPAVVVGRGNLVGTARLIAEIMASVPPEGEIPGVREWTGPATPAERASAPERAPGGEDALWQGPLPEIVLGHGKRQVHASVELEDYRAEYACRYVLAHFQENINRDRMAEMVNLSPGYFSNLFRAEVGMSFSDYLIQVRIENAKRLLRRFDLSVEAISRQCGFNSLAHFSRTFKDRVGVSPLKYRKNPNGTA